MAPPIVDCGICDLFYTCIRFPSGEKTVIVRSYTAAWEERPARTTIRTVRGARILYNEGVEVTTTTAASDWEIIDRVSKRSSRTFCIGKRGLQLEAPMPGCGGAGPIVER